MARTHIRHVSDSQRARSGGKQNPDERLARKDKSHKQRRANDRAQIKKEYS